MSSGSFIPSEYQKKIFEFITSGKGNAVVSAVAGSGKTTTILNSLNLIDKEKKILYLAFNKDIVATTKKKCDSISNATFNTLHGYGMSILRNKNQDIIIDNYKYNNMLRDIFHYAERGVENKIEAYKFTRKQIKSLDKFKTKNKLSNDDKYKLQRRIIELCNYGRLMLVKNIKQLKSISIKYGVDYFNDECEMAMILIKLGLHYDVKVDYTDMLYFPIELDIHGAKYDWVFIDECQDLNIAQRTLMLRAVKEGSGRWIAVGDPAQAIYAFSGADSFSFKALTKIPNTKEFPLSVCYRCDKKIIDLAKTLVPYIEFFDKNGEGQIDYKASKDDIKANDMVLCRNTYPLVKMCFEYLKNGIKATIKGRDIGKNLINIILDSKKEGLDELFDYLYDELDKTKKRIIKINNIPEKDAETHDSYIKQKENIEIIELLGSDSSSPKDIIKKLSDMFSDSDDEGIHLSTIHKAKGLESDRVFIIHKELIPSKHAKEKWQIEQEYNLLYVAITRAKKHLGFVIDFDALEGKEKFDKSEIVNTIIKPKHVGRPNGHYFAKKLKLLSKKEVATFMGDTMMWKFVDVDGNIFTKFGVIPLDLELNKKEIDYYVIIKEHREFNGVKENSISKILTKEHYDYCIKNNKNIMNFSAKKFKKI